MSGFFLPLKTRQNTSNIKQTPFYSQIHFHQSLLFSFKFLQAKYILTVFSSPIHSLTAFWFHHSSNFPTGKSQGLILLSLAIIHDSVVCSPPGNFYLKCYHYPLLIHFVLPLTSTSSISFFGLPFFQQTFILPMVHPLLLFVLAV